SLRRACKALRQVFDASRMRWASVLGLALLLALSACGGSRRAADEYRQRVNAICLTLYRTRLPRGRAARLTAIVKAEGAAVASMRALGPPASLAGLHRRVAAGSQAGASPVARART